MHGDPVDVVWVKGSGWDMGVDRAGRVRAAAARRRWPAWPSSSRCRDSTMANELKAASLDIAAPAPSVESILHATLPHRFVMHTHADAVVALTNTPDGRDDRARRLRRRARGRSVRDAGLRPRPAVRRDLPGRGPRRHHRHGAAQPRPVHVRRRRPHRVRAPRRAGRPGGGPPRGRARRLAARRRSIRSRIPNQAGQLTALADLRARSRTTPATRWSRAAAPTPLTRRFAARTDLAQVSAAGHGDAGSRAAHQAPAAARARRRRLRRRLRGLRRAQPLPARRPPAHPGRPRASRSSSIRSWASLTAGRRVGDARTAAEIYAPHHRDHRGVRVARRLPQHQRGRPVRRRVLGARAGQARPPAGARRPSPGRWRS